MGLSLTTGRTFSRIAILVCLALIVFAYARVYTGDEATASDASNPNPGTAATEVSTASSGTARDIPIYCVDRDDQGIALTFDAAWGADKTLAILDILDEKGIKATFFLVGFWVDKYPDMVREIARRGHVIGNHSSSHPNMPQLTKAKQVEELQQTSEKIEALTGQKPTVFRPPFGDYDNAVVASARETGMATIQWDVDSLDWKDKGTAPLIDQVMGKVRSGSIVLFHNNSTYITEALPTIIDRLQAKGYVMKTVPDLLLDGDTYTDHEGRQRRR